MSDKFKVTYGNDDGYAGGARPHTFGIDAADLWDDMTDSDLTAMFWEQIEEDFTNNHLHPYSKQEAEFIAWAKEQIAKAAGQ